MMKNLYYGDSKHLDIQKFREDAATTSRGDKNHAPMPVTIHFHKYGEHCFGQVHEDYKDGEQVQDVREG